MSKFVCFRTPGLPNNVYDADIIKEKTIQQLSVINNAEGKVLFVKTPRFIKRIPDDCNILDEYPDIVLDKRPDIYNDVPNMLTFLDKSESDFLSIKITPIIENPHIPPYYAKINIATIEQMNTAELMETITNQLGLPIQNPSLMFGEEEVDENESASRVVGKAQVEDLLLKFDITEELTNKTKKRVNIEKEIIYTEETYIKDLTTIVEFWQPNCANVIKMDPLDMDQIFKNIGPILNCHKLFLEELKANGSNYEACFAGTFLKFSQIFKFSQMYISNYQTIQQIVSGYESKAKFAKLFKKLQSECNEKNFQSYLITPVQRMPRYTLFMKELVKNTPPSHPDSNLIKYAAEQIDIVTKQIDQVSTSAKLQKKLFDLQQKISDQFTFLDKQRQLLSEYTVQVIERSNVTGTIFFFDDILMFIKDGSKGQKIIFDAPITAFPFIPGKPNATSITVDASGKEYAKRMLRDHHEYQVDFQSVENYEKFFGEYEKQLTMLMLKSNCKFGFKWTANKAQESYPIVGKHLAIRISGRIYIFSGKDYNNIHYLSISSDFKSRAVTNEECPLPALKSPKIVSIGHTICIISTGFLYVIDPHTHSVEAKKITGFYTPRTGESLISYDNYLYVFGGQTSTTKFVNDLVMIDPNSGASEQINAQNAPPARSNHNAVVLGDKMFIIGGTNEKTTFTDVYFFDLKDRIWTKLDINLHHSSIDSIFAINNHIVILSAKGEIQMYNIRSNETLAVENFGNIANNLQGFGSVMAKSNDVVLLTSPKDKIVYSVDFPDILKVQSGTRHLKDSQEISKVAKQRGKHFKDGSSSSSSGSRPKHFGQTDIDLSEAADHFVKVQSPLRSPSSSIFDINPNPDRQIDMDVPSQAPERKIDFKEEEEKHEEPPKQEKTPAPVETPKSEEIPATRTEEKPELFPPSMIETKNSSSGTLEEEHKSDINLDENKVQNIEVPSVKNDDEEPKKTSIVTTVVIGVAAAAAVGAALYFTFRKFSHRN